MKQGYFKKRFALYRKLEKTGVVFSTVRSSDVAARGSIGQDKYDEVITIPPNAGITLIDQRFSPTDETVVVIAEANSLVDYFTSSRRVTCYLKKHALVRLYWYSRSVKSYQVSLRIIHQEKESRGFIYAIGEGLSRSRTEFLLENRHLAPDTFGRIDFAGIVRDQAQSKITGTIVIAPNARNTDSSLTEDARLLSPLAKAEVIPNLEILNNDVRAHHRATVGQFPEWQRYYLTTRGLDETQANQLLIKGFNSRIINKVTSKEVKQRYLNLSRYRL